jgi:AcrR family transcriptional regulator
MTVVDVSAPSSTFRMATAPVRPLPRKPTAKARGKPMPSAVRETLTPQAWIDAATAVLVDEGIDHVRVDVLASQLQVTRGSFYWHFRDREDLLRRVLQHWSEQTTEQLTRRLAGARSDPREQLQDVISLPFRGRAAARAARIELAIRAWARRDPIAQQAVDDADAARLDYHQQIFEALGFAGEEARSRGFLLYCYEVAESLLTRQSTAASKQTRSAFVSRLVVQPLKR